MARKLRSVSDMSTPQPLRHPPFCPNPRCAHHRVTGPHWQVVRLGFYARQTPPLRVQRYRCGHCRRQFSDQTFSLTYWLKRPELLLEIAASLIGCSGYRQIARARTCAPTTVLTHAARLGRHALLFHQRYRPPVDEALALDGFISFEFSQYAPTAYHVAVGQRSHFGYGFTDSELRRSGAMRPAQRRRRAALERRHGRPDPRATEHDVTVLLALLCPDAQRLELHTDEHRAYPRAVRQLAHLEVDHRTISSRAARTVRNPLFPVNLLDLLIRHSGANHKRESIAFSKRRQSAVERLWVFLAWRNYVKSFSERRQDASPAMRLGLMDRRWSLAEVFGERLFPGRIALPERWQRYYERRIDTRYLARNRRHQLRYAF
jgi:transposase-like protein